MIPPASETSNEAVWMLTVHLTKPYQFYSQEMLSRLEGPDT